MKISKRILRSN